MTRNATKHRQERMIRAREAGAAQAGAKRMASNLSQRNRISGEQMQCILGPVRTALIAFRMDTAGTIQYHDCAAALSVAYYVASRIERHRHLMPVIKEGLDALTEIFDRVDDHEWQTYFCTDDELARIDTAADVYEALLLVVTWPFLKRAISDAMPKGC